MGLLGDFTAYIDGLKRRGMNTAKDLASDPMGLLGRNVSALSESLPAAPGEPRNEMLARPGMQDWATGVAMNAPTMGLLGHTVYHGSPHKFDKFDASRAGKHGGTSFGLGHNLSSDAKHASAYKGEGGQLYKVDLDDEAIPKMLSWEQRAPAEITKQVPKVDKSKPIPFGGGATIAKEPNGWVLNAGGDTKFKLSEYEVSRMFDGDKGEQVYRRLVASLGSEEAASAWLRDRGVPGIVNNTERGVRNYTVFPGMEGLLKILERE